ncbi:hypothetical protein BJV82DRAFT_675411 [Fennellomyces sp. T-0311]|nr:hypothetical protein BJV82DRAFT_675411 [Fennellomyces sp. T-0311]
MLQQCPNLVHLFLDSGLSVYYGHCIKQAVKYCLRLRNLVVSDNAEMPETMIDHVKEDEYRISDKKAPPEQPQTIRLRIFAFAAMLTSYEPGDVISTYATTY